MSNLIELIKLAQAAGELCQVTQGLKAENARLKVSLDLAQTDARTYKQCYEFTADNAGYWMRKYNELKAKVARADVARQRLNEQRNYKERKRKLRKKMRKRKFRPYEPDFTIAERYWRWRFWNYAWLRAELDEWKEAHRVKTP